jgi:hypothetical protein
MSIKEKLYGLIDQIKEIGECDISSLDAQNRITRAKREKVLNSIIEDYPLLRFETGYIEFIKEFGAITLIGKENSLTSAIYGIGSSSRYFHLKDSEGDIVDEEGFMTIMDISYTVMEDGEKVYQDTAFGIDTTGAREKGIYRYSGAEDYKWFCNDFLELLGIVVTKRFLV